MPLTTKSIAVFARPFSLPGFDETLPAGDYEIETELSAPPGHLDPGSWKASVFVKLHTRASHPGLTRVLTVSLTDLDHARARDKISGRELADVFLEEMLSDPLVLSVMQADGVSVAQLRSMYPASPASRPGEEAPGRTPPAGPLQDDPSICAAENEGMPVTS